ncbi:hypothetical protein [Streptomyces sp. NPDC002845]
MYSLLARERSGHSQLPISGQPPTSWGAAHGYAAVLSLYAFVGGPHLAGSVTAGWLYHRYRRVIPLALAHASYNTLNSLFGVPLLPVLALTLAAAVWAWRETRTGDEAHA